MMRPLPLLLPLFLAACTPGCPKDDTGTDGPLLLSDANNYTFTGDLDIPTIRTAVGADLLLDWTAVTEDIQCHGLDPSTDVDFVYLVRFAIPEEEVEAGINTDSLVQSSVTGFLTHDNAGEATSTTLTTFDFMGTPVDVTTEYVDDGSTYLLLLSTGSTLGVNTRLLTFLAPDATSDVTEVHLASGCGLLTLDVDLGTLDPVRLPGGSPTTVDWSGLTRDGQDQPLDFGALDSLMIGHYPDATPADLEAGFLDLEASAAATWTLSLPGGTTADLAEATDGSTPFPGVDDTGLWILALRCGTCYNPAPPFLTFLQAD